MRLVVFVRSFRFGSVRFDVFRFVSFLYVSIPFVSICFVSIRFDSIRVVLCQPISIRFGWVCVDPFRFGSVRYGSSRFGAVRYGSVRFGSVQLNYFNCTKLSAVEARACVRRTGGGQVKSSSSRLSPMWRFSLVRLCLLLPYTL